MLSITKNMVERIAYFWDGIGLKGNDIHIESLCVGDGYVGVLYRVGRVPVVSEMELMDFEKSFFKFLSEKDKCVVFKVCGVNRVLNDLVSSGVIDSKKRREIIKGEVEHEGP